MDIQSYTEKNSKAIDMWVGNGWCWGIPISHEIFVKAQNGEWKVVLTPIKSVPKEWFAPYYKESKLNGVKLLGLASGGGQQMPVFAALGADCTILDYSDKQLESEKIVSEREGYKINIVKADMTKRLPFGDNNFDVIFHPVSNCYVEDVYHVWNECYRVLKPGGILIAGMGNSVGYLFNDDYGDENNQLFVVNKFPVNPINDPEWRDKHSDLDDALEFSHTLEEQIGGQLKAGFILTDLYEDLDSGSLLSQKYNFSEYICTRAVKPRLSRGELVK
ncbi:MAG: class I SAM-dependent methyltransferase [Oscillospiraceae bacterium]|nr:class I SAM-dependent methyltransferase [Oscillospiraceae bacterium]